MEHMFEKHKCGGDCSLCPSTECPDLGRKQVSAWER